MKTKQDDLQDEFSKEFIAKGFKGLAYLCPRFGKIKFTLNCLKKTDSVLVVYPEVSIKNSWQTDIKKWKFKGKVDYSTSMSFKKIRKVYDVLVIDEIHLLSEAQIQAVSEYLYNTGIKKVIGLSGTLSDDTQAKLSASLGLDVLVEYSISQAIIDGVICDYKIDVVYVPLSTVPNIKVTWKGGEFMTSEKSSFDYITNKINISHSSKLKMLRLLRMSMIKKSKAKIAATQLILKTLLHKRVLVFTGLIEVAESLGIPTYHSKSKSDIAKDSFIMGNSNKLAVVKQLNTGVTFKSLDTAIINFFDSNSENMAQKISRITCKEMFNEGKVAHIVIICSTEEIEKKWLMKSLSFFDSDKINFINP